MKMEINYSDDDRARYQAVNLFSFCSKAECLNLDFCPSLKWPLEEQALALLFLALFFSPRGGHLVVTQNKTNKKALKKKRLLLFRYWELMLQLGVNTSHEACVFVNMHFMCIYVCVCTRTCYLFTHLCQPQTPCCCPTLLLPW